MEVAQRVMINNGDGTWDIGGKDGHGDRLTICPYCGAENRVFSSQITETTELYCSCGHFYVVHPR